MRDHRVFDEPVVEMEPWVLVSMTMATVRET
jgi:hypothetical protein